MCSDGFVVGVLLTFDHVLLVRHILFIVLHASSIVDNLHAEDILFWDASLNE